MMHNPAENMFVEIFFLISLLFILAQMVIDIKDVNDNAPQFINSVSTFGKFIFYRWHKGGEAECCHAVTTK